MKQLLTKSAAQFLRCQRFAAALEPLYSKMERLIKAESGKTPTDKEKEVRYNEDSNLFVGRSLQEE